MLLFSNNRPGRTGQAIILDCMNPNRKIRPQQAHTSRTHYQPHWRMSQRRPRRNQQHHNPHNNQPACLGLGTHFHLASLTLNNTATVVSNVQANHVAIPNSAPTSLAWSIQNRQAILISLYAIAFLTIALTLQTTTAASPFPSVLAAILMGAIFGQLGGMLLWQTQRPETTFACWAIGLISISIAAPMAATCLGGPNDQWWTALAFLCLASRVAWSAFDHQVSEPTPARRAKPNGQVSLVNLLSFTLLLSLVFVMAQSTQRYPMVSVQSFVWFGGLAVLVAIARYAYRQILVQVQKLSTASQEVFTTWSLLDCFGIILVVLTINLLIMVVLQRQISDPERLLAVLTVCRIAQLWQVIDLTYETLVASQATQTRSNLSVAARSPSIDAVTNPRSLQMERPSS